MLGLTPKQRELLTFLETYMAANRGQAPSYDEMAAAVGLKSKSGAHRLIEGLEERGRVRRLPNRTRAIEIIRPDETAINLSAVASTDLLREVRRRGYQTTRAA